MINRRDSIYVTSPNTTVLIYDGCDDYTLPTLDGVRIDPIFTFHTCGLLDSALEVLTGDAKLTVAQTDDIKCAIQRAYFLDNHSAVPLFLDRYGPIEYGTVYALSGTIENLHAYTSQWARNIIERSKTVSGDDDIVDYFPSHVDGFRDLCEGLGLVNTFNDTLSELIRTSVYGTVNGEYDFEKGYSPALGKPIEQSA